MIWEWVCKSLKPGWLQKVTLYKLFDNNWKYQSFHNPLWWCETAYARISNLNDCKEVTLSKLIVNSEAESRMWWLSKPTILLEVFGGTVGTFWLSPGSFGDVSSHFRNFRGLQGSVGPPSGPLRGFWCLYWYGGDISGLWIPRKGSKTKSASIPPAPNPASLSKNGPIRLQLSKSCNELCKK